MKIKFKLASRRINISISKVERETISDIFVNEWKHDACVYKTNQELNSIEQNVIYLSIKTINKIKRDCVVT